MIGQMLRHYRIEAKMGSGPLGVVYRARDTHLNREVAIKILPAAGSEASEQRARLARETKAASALNHPHIANVYDIGSAEFDGAWHDFVVMEHLAGKTLDKLIRNSPLPLPEALSYAIQIAGSLDAAHTAGIVHGNLAPAKIIVNKDGELKILDFGLAALTDPQRPDPSAETEQLSPGRTDAAGDAAYQSPESAEGQPIDARSDVFSFGAVIYEMFTGRRAFAGDSYTAVASVLNSDPTPMDADGIPSELQRIIIRCLAKNPQQRWQRMASVKIALEDVREEVAASKQAITVRRGTRQSPFLGPALLVVALTAGVYVGSKALAPPYPTFQRLTYRRGDILGARFAPDGTVLFNAQWANDPSTIFSQHPGSAEARALDLPGARILSISSSDEMAILLGSTGSSVSGTLARVPVSGGAPREVLENVNDADWSPDGSSLAVVHIVGQRNRIEYPIGNVLAESGGRAQADLRVSRKGDLLAFFEYDSAVADWALTILDLTGRKRILSRGWTAIAGLAWSPRGDEIWFSGAKTGGEPMLRAVKMDGSERTVLDAPCWIALKDVTRAGRVLATVSDTRVGILYLTPDSERQRDLSWFDASRIYDISADGHTIVFVEMSYGRPRNTAVYLRHTDGSPAVHLGDCNKPALSPDSKWVACISSDGPRTTINLLPAGAGEVRTIDGHMHYERVEWFPDGQTLLITATEPNRRPRTYLQALSGGPATPLTSEGMEAAHISPDQKFAAVVAAGKLSLFPMKGGDLKSVAPLDLDESVVRWSADGRYLFLRKAAGAFTLKVLRLEVATGRKQEWRELKTPDPVGVQIRDLVITPDGATLAYSFQRDIATLYVADGLR